MFQLSKNERRAILKAALERGDISKTVALEKNLHLPCCSSALRKNFFLSPIHPPHQDVGIPTLIAPLGCTPARVASLPAVTPHPTSDVAEGVQANHPQNASLIYKLWTNA